MRRYPVGVAVAAVDVRGTRLGLTVSSLASLALDPPLVGISIAWQAAFHELLRDAGSFAVSLLAADQVSLARHFARGVPPIAMWEGIGTRQGERGPLLEGAVGWLECRLASEVDTGDHTFFVWTVEAARRGPAPDALVHLRREYS